MMLYFTKEKHSCTGCGACKAICPVNCISFIPDEEGFLYPVADSRCKNCGKCERVCPVINSCNYNLNEFKQFCVVGCHKNNRIWEKSSSGGAFTAICQAYCKEDDIIFGARFRGNKVIHDYIKVPGNIDCFRKSKYVQSDMTNCYHQIKSFLDENRKVLFSGTPCQIAGLRNFLGKDYDNLFCVDLICHGVGSPSVFEKYIKFLESKYNSKVKSFKFRNKKIKLGRLLQYVVTIEFENGKKIENENDFYNLAFIQALIIRPSCYKCRFANLYRIGDITIGDFKKKYELLSKVKGLQNFSIILINSIKGQKVFEELQNFMEIYYVDIKDIVENTPLSVPSKMNNNREAFFSDLEKTNSMEELFRKYINYPKLYKQIWMFLPDEIRGAIKRRLRR